MRQPTGILLNILGCDECPKVRRAHTPGTGFGEDYFCTAVSPERKTMGYIEWDSEKTEVPAWCPIRVACRSK
jgi:hypothetical protein